MGPVNVVLDIDGVLCCNSATSESEALFYLRKGAIISAIKTHYVFPGVIEFMQLLFRTEDIKVSFFSSGDRRRNELFVKELLERAIGIEEYKKIQEDIVVLSRGDLAFETELDQKIQFQTYGLLQDSEKKDISIVLKEQDQLSQAVLIDDQTANTMYGQEKNLLLAPSVQNGEYHTSLKGLESYNEEGYMETPCVITAFGKEGQIHRKWNKKNVISGKRIQVLKVESGYEIGFLNGQTGQYEQRKISTEENGQLIKLLDEMCQDKNGEEIYLNSDSELQESIRTLVHSYGGETKRLYRELNRICYLAGMLFNSMEVAQKESIPLTQVLFRRQFKEKRDVFKPKFEKLEYQQKYYLFGLEKLKEVNSDFTFSTPKSYYECINIPIKSEEEKLVKEAMSNEAVGCVIM